MLEVEWWRVHREHQHGPGGQTVDAIAERGEAILGEERPLVDALADLYAYTYGVDPADVRVAAEQRALAMRYSDRWVAEGCDLGSPLIPRERKISAASTAAPSVDPQPRIPTLACSGPETVTRPSSRSGSSFLKRLSCIAM